MTAIAPLADAIDDAAFGGKAAQLARSIRGGIQVPSGFAIAWNAACEADAIARAFDALGGGPVAVRSSAIGEDGASASFAGQHVSILNVVDRHGLTEAIAAVAASAEGSAAYRAKRGIAAPARMGIVVQRLVDAECAGVLFTRDPATGREAIIVEAAWGLGETVVQGLVVPERHRLERATGRLLETTRGDLDVAIVARPGGGTEEIAPAMLRDAILDAPRLDALVALARRCDAVFASADHDIEWAFAHGTKEPVLLQRRPITALQP